MTHVNNNWVKDEGTSPLVTFALFAYNQEKYIREAIEGALAQNYSPLEIIFSDDCSTDRTFEIMSELASEYKGSTQLRLNRNSVNMGIGAHVQRVMEMAKGEIIVMAAGDDISKPWRVTKVVDGYSVGENILGFISGFDFVDGNSCKTDMTWIPNELSNQSLEKMASGVISCPGASCAWSKRVLDGWFPLDGVIHEDRVFPFRVLLLGGKIKTSDELLVSYRSSGGVSKTSREDILNEPRRMRISQLRRVLPDAKLRLKDFDSAFSNSAFATKLRSILDNEICKLQAEIDALTSTGLGFERGYLGLMLLNVSAMSTLRTYLKIRFKFAYVIFRKIVSKW